MLNEQTATAVAAAKVAVSTDARFVPVAYAPTLPAPAGTVLGTVSVLPHSWKGVVLFDNTICKAVKTGSPTCYTVQLAVDMPVGPDVIYSMQMMTIP